MNDHKTEVAPIVRFAHAQFCDDIRFEVGNKVTLVGIYNHALFLHELPAFIPRIGVSLFVETPIENPIETMVVRIEMGDEILMETTHPVIAPNFVENEILDEHDKLTRMTFSMHTPLPPITITSPCMLRVIATIDGVAHIAGKLRISVAPTSQQPV